VDFRANGSGRKFETFPVSDDVLTLRELLCPDLSVDQVQSLYSRFGGRGTWEFNNEKLH
jgi:hypothetical protein